MRKIITISVFLIIIISCNRTKEEVIVNRLESELNKRGLEIDSSFGLLLTISPNNDKFESLSTSVYELMDYKNEDTLNKKIIEQAVRLENWFGIPEWEKSKHSIFPYLNSLTSKKDSLSVIYPLNNHYGYYFHHQNYDTHKYTPITQRELKIWNVPIQKIVKWAFTNLEKEINFEVYLDTLENKDIYRFRPFNERYHTSIMFTNNFKEELKLKLDYPFYSVLRPWYYPTIIFGHDDLNFFKTYLETKSIENIDTEYPYEMKIIKYAENEIKIIE
ncbi:hypothetical protein HZY62_21525 [Maribacter polysiphoniae]|uniref:Lipoprotein n=1 Tax=Maribacter polysiphoniae TaxID=429344 RepID=A0A316DLM9_9FLAO|nr:hypothetical protein [Maribacter polysiphoniae]MBD1263182.1 hypothetical protein [Maribacter polysiphoniae]PWK18452.1 hypothetical protein LX92_04326 [Maribacter polysiphoniae]